MCVTSVKGIIKMPENVAEKVAFKGITWVVTVRAGTDLGNLFILKTDPGSLRHSRGNCRGKTAVKGGLQGAVRHLCESA